MLDAYILHDASDESARLASRLYIILKEIFPTVRVGASFLDEIRLDEDHDVRVSFYIANNDFPTMATISLLMDGLDAGRRKYAIFFGNRGALDRLDALLEAYDSSLFDSFEIDGHPVEFGNEFVNGLLRFSEILLDLPVDARTLVGELATAERTKVSSSNDSDFLSWDDGSPTVIRNMTNEGDEVFAADERESGPKPTDVVSNDVHHLDPYSIDEMDRSTQVDSAGAPRSDDLFNIRSGNSNPPVMARRGNAGRFSMADDYERNKTARIDPKHFDKGRLTKSGIIVVVFGFLTIAAGLFWLSKAAIGYLGAKGSFFFFPFNLKKRVAASIFAPRKVRSGDLFQVQVFLHQQSEKKVASAQKLASEIDPDSSIRGSGLLSDYLTPGDELCIMLRPQTNWGVHFSIEGEAYVKLIWNGDTVTGSLFVTALPNTPSAAHIFTAIVTRNGVPLGEFRFRIDVKLGSQPIVREMSEVQSKQYKKIFVSYARKDLQHVTPVVRTLQSLGIDYFMDTRDLKPGEDWEAVLRYEIENSDLVLLFWSNQARDSEMVKFEVEHAIKREALRGSPSILPFPIEGPPPPEPWPILSRLHVGDPIYYGLAQQVKSRR